MSTTTGTANFVVGDETYKTWYKVLGNLKSGVRPLVLLHGGPGIPHHGLLGHDELFKTHSIPVVWYDQLGCGSSTHLPHKGEDFWTPRLFMDELENLVKHLGIADSFDLLGHSWGGMLAAQWAATRHPAGLNRIVLADTPAAMHLWDESSAILLPQMPLELRDTIKRGEESGDLDDPAYKAAMHAYYGMFCCRCNPWPEEATISHVEMARDPTVYNVMAGPNEFHISGTLKTWDITDIIHTITQPTLLVNGRYDMAQDIAVSPFFEKIPKVKWAHFSKSSHMPYWEEPESYYQIVGRFLSA